MMRLLENVIRQTFDRLSNQFAGYAPGLLAGILILLVAYGLARLARWLLSRIFKGVAIDRFLRQSGLSSMLDRSGRFRAVDLVAKTAFWLILFVGVLTGLSAVDTQLTSRITETVIGLSPKLLTAAVILVAGIWLGRYLGRHILVWAVNEGIPSGRRLALAVRLLVAFVAVTAAADHLDFARNVFLAAFVLVVGGVVLAASLAFGLYGKEVLRHHLQEKAAQAPDKEESSIWKHL